MIFPLIMVLSAYFFFTGHNTPGGGFAGGLTAGLALVLRYLAGGRYELGETLPFDAGKILGAGLALSSGTAVGRSYWRAGAVVGGDLGEPAVAGFGQVCHRLILRLGRLLDRGGFGARCAAQPRRADRHQNGGCGEQPVNTYLVPLVIIGGLTSSGVYLLLSRNLTRMLLGLLLVGNAVNLLIMTVGGPSGNPRSGAAPADPRRPPRILWRRA